MTSTISRFAVVTSLVLGLSTSCSNGSINEPGIVEASVNMLAIDEAVEATRHDPSAACFVVVLPADETQAFAIRDQWLNVSDQLGQHEVYFVTDDDAHVVLDAAYIESAPAAIVYRNGRAYHSRTGELSDKNIHALIALGLDNTAPMTSNPDQTAFLFDSLATSTQDQQTAKGACQLMLNLHALVEGPYATTYSATDLGTMNEIYSQSQFALAQLDMQAPGVIDEINRASTIAMKTWETRTESVFGIGIWFDLALSSGNEDAVIAWVDEKMNDPKQFDRVAQSLFEYGDSIASLLIETNRFEAFALTFPGTEAFNQQLASYSDHAQSQETMSSTIDNAAAYHSALLLVGRNTEAWEVADALEDFAGAELASVALCSSAIETGVLEDKHAFLVRNLNQAEHATLIQQLNTSFAVVPTDD